MIRLYFEFDTDERLVIFFIEVSQFYTITIIIDDLITMDNLFLVQFMIRLLMGVFGETNI